MIESGFPVPNDPETPRILPAAEVFAGLPLTRDPRLAQARLSAVAATTLRAALDLLLGEERPVRPLSVWCDDGALEVRLRVAQPEALAIAGGLMESVGGSLGRANGGRAEWILRVPVLGSRPMYLMLEQGTFALAVPWHSVVRVRMASRASVEAIARREGAPVLPPFVSVPAETEERPAVLLGFGLRRAYLIADRLIWRIPAEPAAEGPRAPGLPVGRSVRTDQGEVFWALDPARLLSEVEPVPLPEAAPPPAPKPAAPEPKPKPAPPESEPRPRAMLALIELRAEDVESLDPVPLVLSALADPSPEPEPPPAPARRALIAEDSLIARIFLERLLARRGFTVEFVTTARELSAQLERGPWSLVLADVELPDAPDAEHLAMLAETRAAPCVTLVRDRADEQRAEAAGLERHLRKPFESEHLDRLLLALGLGADR